MPWYPKANVAPSGTVDDSRVFLVTAGLVADIEWMLQLGETPTRRGYHIIDDLSAKGIVRPQQASSGARKCMQAKTPSLFYSHAIADILEVTSTRLWDKSGITILTIQDTAWTVNPLTTPSLPTVLESRPYQRTPVSSSSLFSIRM